MPNNQITNPGYSTESNYGAISTAQFIATGALTKGMLVQLLTTYPTTSGVGAKVKKATTTGNFLLVGVVSKSVTSGTVVTVITNGPAQVLRHVTVGITKAQAVLQTGTNSGYAKSTATAVLGKTLGVALQTVASTVATGFAWVYVSRM